MFSKSSLFDLKEPLMEKEKSLAEQQNDLDTCGSAALNGLKVILAPAFSSFINYLTIKGKK